MDTLPVHEIKCTTGLVLRMEKGNAVTPANKERKIASCTYWFALLKNANPRTLRYIIMSAKIPRGRDAVSLTVLGIVLTGKPLGKSRLENNKMV
jgi:hypothetical protein